MDFKIGDKVVRNYVEKSSSGTIGTIIKITPKRRDIIVDFGNYKETYNDNGWQKGGSDCIWSRSNITLLTPELALKISQKRLIQKCKNKVANMEITADQASQILEILNEVRDE